jgi:hypothetical protein
MPPLIGTRFCHSHTPGLAAEAGRRGGLNRRRPVPPRKTMRPPVTPPAVAAAPAADSRAPDVPLDVPVAVMSAGQVRIYLQTCVTRAVAGELDEKLARLAVSATNPWLAAIALDERIADLEKRLAAIERASETSK